ncbi:MAG: hypothetical protein HYS81_01590 [Candidatus Aenigmatarchaeota archaeon]|nr:MAG: hypothetical protein HYS81_01590 [Candidatus Aenigmarchaeota archaeon]
MPSKDDIKKTIEDLRGILQRNIPDDDKSVLRGVIDSLEDFLKIPYDEEGSPFQQKKHYGTIYKKRVGKI